MHKIEAGKFLTGSTFPKQYWLAVNGKPTILGKTRRVLSETKAIMSPPVCHWME